MENPEAYRRAKRRVEAKLGFYIHLAVYVVVNAMLMTINLSHSLEHLWFQWSVAGWGIGLLFHALAVFVFCGQSGLKEKMIEKEMEKEALKKQ